MRLFFIEWANTIPELVEIVRDIKKRGHEIVYWSGYKQDLIDKTDFPDTIFHDYHDALAGKPAAGVDDSKFLPPGENLLKQLYGTESIILTMMNKKYSRLSVGERKHFYYHLLKYWHGIIQKLKPEVIIFLSIPHTVYDFIIYSLAQLFKIKTVMFDYTWVNDRAIALNNYLEGNVELKKIYQENQEDFSINHLSPDLQAYFKRMTDIKTDPTPVWIYDCIKNYSGIKNVIIKLKMVWYNLKDFSIFKKIIYFLFKQFKSNLKKEYLSVQSKPDLNKKFIYFPLHFQPECTTSPLGGSFVDQLLAIETLSAVLPEDWLIYVKEHPTQLLPMGLNFSIFRYQSYYKHLAAIKNVCVMPLETKSALLIERSQAVATITGTAAWEAVFRNRPALVFGYPWFRHCAGIFEVRDAVSCREALGKIMNGYQINQQAIINYLVFFDKFSIRGYYDSWTKKISSVTPQENKNNFLSVLIKEIEN